MVDVSKIRVGDEVTFRGTVTMLDPYDKELPCRIGRAGWCSAEQIIEHKPRELKAGDKAHYCLSNAKVEVLCVHNGHAFVVWPEGNHSVYRLSDLRHADEAP